MLMDTIKAVRMGKGGLGGWGHGDGEGHGDGGGRI